MKKIFVIISSVLVFATSCTKLSSLNDDPKKAAVVPGEMLFSSAEKNLYDNLTSNSVNLNVFRLLAQYQAQVTYIDESRYDLGTRNIPQAFWQALYRDVLKDLSAGKALIKADSALLPADAIIKKNKLAIIDITEAYTNFILVTCYGNIPYTETMDINKLDPKFDDQKTVYYDLLDRLKADVAALDVSQGSFGTADLIYQGNVASWIKLANSMRLKMGLVIADIDNAKAVEVINDAATNVFTSNADNAILKYLSSEPNTNPIWVDLVKSKRKDYVIPTTLVDPMNATNDPRRPFYYTATGSGAYVGGVYGSGNVYSSYSHVSAKITAPDFEAILMDYAEVEFALAEAVARGGFSVSGTAADHYNKGIAASITYWGGSAADAATFIAQPTVDYATLTGTWQQKIGMQKYIALYNRGYDAWLEWRRLDYPILNAPVDISYSNIPVRLTYPVSEQNLNKTQYDAAAAAIGGDKVTTKLFWDRF
ncbi:SusD/RagB family nutrient-binding outer membrane lipoprotein [Chitinophaga oryziterrae]|uniref:SusD/RagB family nutrient-binding outer membrane lipoprotein n=1 Tax=Chitinophaga oryziterrae TaxID=1031224 RepID=A0A6N8J2D2_9BACT|nr:SusD/RagB family nutrient-binding outer membrane lipoprotein [Chitinophaga oryziterrae]MVT39365.1 SusD/RagB family nutrient-binding outer membrane lipoprotein [Chitinophaga oryziterrae]